MTDTDVKISLGELFYSRWRGPRPGTGLFVGQPWESLMDHERQAVEDGAQAVAEAVRLTDPHDIEPDGQWLSIAFMGHVELTGYVTEVTVGGQPTWHVDLPEKLWGGNPMAWEEYSGSALYSRRPVTEASVRKAWEARVARDRERAQRNTEQAERLALDAADDDELTWGGGK